jgi:hypothetical protein
MAFKQMLQDSCSFNRHSTEDGPPLAEATASGTHFCSGGATSFDNRLRFLAMCSSASRSSPIHSIRACLGSVSRSTGSQRKKPAFLHLQCFGLLLSVCVPYRCLMHWPSTSLLPVFFKTRTFQLGRNPFALSLALPERLAVLQACLLLVWILERLVVLSSAKIK